MKKQNKKKAKKKDPSEDWSQMHIFSTGGRRYVGSMWDRSRFDNVYEIVSVVAMTPGGVSSKIYIEYPDAQALTKEPIGHMHVDNLDWWYPPNKKAKSKIIKAIEALKDE